MKYLGVFSKTRREAECRERKRDPELGSATTRTSDDDDGEEEHFRFYRFVFM